MEEDSQDWKRICEDLRDFGKGFIGICEILGMDLQGFVRLEFMRLWERIHEICEMLGKDLQGFVRLWERIFDDS